MAGVAEDLALLHQTTAKRQYFNKFNPTEIHIHVSIKAYDAAVYLSSNTDTTFVIAKSWLAPLKSPTLSRLELTTALTAVGLVKFVIDSLELPNSPIHVWVDSQIALYWIHSSKKLPEFVANRVSEINHLLPSVTWKHCPSSANPADLLTMQVYWREINSSLYNNSDYFWTKKDSWDAVVIFAMHHWMIMSVFCVYCHQSIISLCMLSTQSCIMQESPTQLHLSARLTGSQQLDSMSNLFYVTVRCVESIVVNLTQDQILPHCRRKSIAIHCNRCWLYQGSVCSWWRLGSKSVHMLVHMCKHQGSPLGGANIRAVHLFKEMCHKCLDMTPTRSCKPGTSPPWMNHTIKRHSHRKQRAYNLARKSYDWQRYWQLKKEIKCACCQAHNSCIQNLITPGTYKTTKRLWITLRARKKIIVPLLQGEAIISDTSTRTNLLNNYFSSIFC